MTRNRCLSLLLMLNAHSLQCKIISPAEWIVLVKAYGTWYPSLIGRLDSWMDFPSFLNSKLVCSINSVAYFCLTYLGTTSRYFHCSADIRRLKTTEVKLLKVQRSNSRNILEKFLPQIRKLFFKKKEKEGYSDLLFQISRHTSELTQPQYLFLLVIRCLWTKKFLRHFSFFTINQ